MRNILKSRVITNNQKGMTLLEIMIVLVILGGLVASLVTVVMGRLKSARIKQAKITMAEVGKALDMYYTDCGAYPSSEQGLGALVQAPGDGCSSWGPDPYIKKVPRDPWNHEYIYESQGGTYVLQSLGRDNREGGTGEDEDLSSENL
ncbi:MAG: type II secretion system major pseudopilin GspG [Bdellovibrionales bacterium]|nr:type II secretion system major pseudopilin GspG [Bdellovibrionales bacterium]